MPNRDHGRSLDPSEHARRGFLKRAVLATSGVSAVGLLTEISRAATREKTAGVSSTNCPSVKKPMEQVHGRVAFITGGSSGIGLGIARAFTDAGMKVVIGYRTKEHLDEAMKFLGPSADRVHAISVDVTDRSGMARSAAETVQVFGKVHVLVNNAGVAGFAPVSSTTYADWDWMMNVNVNGVFNGIHAFLPHIQAHGEGGQIITTSSTAGLISSRGMVSYSASKFAVVGLMEALRADLADTNIGASVLCPGLVKSNIASSARNRPTKAKESGFSQDSSGTASAEDPMKYFMDPLEAGRLVLRGMRNNDMYILTHPEYEQVMRDRSEALLASTPADLQPAEARAALIRNEFRTSIYSVERDRKICDRAASAKAIR